MMKNIQCCVCGHINTYSHYRYFYELLSIYSVGYTDICEKCADKVHKFLISGVLPMRDYSGLMNGGYYD